MWAISIFPSLAGGSDEPLPLPGSHFSHLGSEKPVGWAWQVLSNLVSYGLEISQDIHDEAQKAACRARGENLP